jgi:CubicO group peptidase (beta-lactamase class C family)
MSKISEIIMSKKHYDGCTLVERMKECHVNAISIALIENLVVSEVYTHGVKRRGKAEEVTIDTLFQAASISKPVFAVAVMRLVESGKLDIDTEISEYLIGYEVPTFDNQKHKITLRQILSHNAGLNLDGFDGYQHGQEVPTIEQILNGAFPSNHLKLKLIKKPETEYMYSGGGYVLAQKIVTDVCKIETKASNHNEGGSTEPGNKCDFSDLMDELVLTPLNMTRSTFLQPLPDDKLNEIAFGYNPHSLEVPGGYDIMPELSAAGLWTTPSDLALLGIEMMKALKGESTFITKKSAKIMTTKAYPKSEHGVGFVVEKSKKGKTFGHRGYNDGYISNMVFFPDDGSGIVAMINSNIGYDLISEVTDAFQEIR